MAKYVKFNVNTKDNLFAKSGKRLTKTEKSLDDQEWVNAREFWGEFDNEKILEYKELLKI